MAPGSSVWQTPGAGEESIAQLIALDAAALVASARVPEALAPTMAEHLDERMGQAILRVYRSAMQPAMRELGEAVASAERTPGLIIDATADPYVPSAMAHDVAAAVGADILTLEGMGHWWMWEGPALVADGLVAFWSKT